MRILMTADTSGGVWTYTLELARALRAAGVDVDVAATGPEPPELPEGVRWRGYALEWMDDPWEDVRAAGDWLLELRDEVRPDVVHLNAFAHGALPWEAPVVVVGHSDVLSWHEAVRGRPAPAAWDRYRASVERGLDAADVLVTPTRWLRDRLVALYRPRCERLVIPNGRDPSSFEPLPKEPFVFTAGRRWDEAKNVAAVERLAPRLPWDVVVAGPDDQSQPFGRDIRDELRRASVFALPARYEPFGLTPLEGGLARCALVLGDLPSLREVWGGAALFVAPDDDAALERALTAVIEDDALRERLARAAYERALTYTPERMRDAYLTLYRRLRALERV
jgi:glycosyltransferase involved in cell wall biosynthesis